MLCNGSAAVMQGCAKAMLRFANPLRRFAKALSELC